MAAICHNLANSANATFEVLPWGKGTVDMELLLFTFGEPSLADIILSIVLLWWSLRGSSGWGGSGCWTGRGVGGIE